MDGGIVGLHADSFDVVVDIAGKPVRRRHPDGDLQDLGHAGSSAVSA
ncbi:hypothetical protein [Lentzea sp. CA-135723]